MIGCELLNESMSEVNLHRCPRNLKGKSMDWFVSEKLKNFKNPKFLLVNKADSGNEKKAEMLCEAAKPYFDGCIAASLREGTWYLC